MASDAQATTPAADVNDIPDDPFRGKSTEFILKNASPDRAYTAEVWAKIMKSLRLRNVKLLEASELIVSKGGKDYKAVYPTLSTRSEKGSPGFMRTVFGSRRRPIVAAFGLSDGVEAANNDDKNADKSEKKRPTPEQWVAQGKSLSSKRNMKFNVTSHPDIVLYLEELNHLLRDTVSEKYHIFNKMHNKKLHPTFVIPGRTKVETNDDDEAGFTLKVFCFLEKGPDFRKGLSRYVPKFVRVTEWGPNDEPIKTEEIEDLTPMVGKETHCIVEAIMPEFSSPPGFMAKQGGLVIYVVEHQMEIDTEPTHGWSSSLEDLPKPIKVVAHTSVPGPGPSHGVTGENGKDDQQDGDVTKANPKKRDRSDDASSSSTSTTEAEGGDLSAAEPDLKKQKIGEVEEGETTTTTSATEDASQQITLEATTAE